MELDDVVDLDTPGFADLYDELPLWSAPFARELLERVPMRRGYTYLDVGCGTGFLSIELAERCGGESTVIAVDTWAAAMDRLRRKAEARGLANVQPHVADAADLVLPDSSVDVVVSNLGVNNFADPDRVLRVCFRAAKPGATLVLSTNVAGHMAELYDAYRTVLTTLGRADRIDLLAEHVAHRGTVRSLTGMVARAGFLVEQTTASSFHMRFADGSALLRHHFIRLGFLDAWKAIAPPDLVPETLAALARELDHIAAREGGLSLTIPIVCLVARKAGARANAADRH